MTPSYPTATRTRSQGMVFLFRWPCYQIQVNTPVDVWSNHACQVALFFPSINTACSSRSVRSCPASELLAQVGGSVNTRSSPAYRKCTPRQPEEHVNPQAASCPRSAKATSVSVVLLSLDSGQGMHPNSLDKVRVRAVGPSWSQRATSNVPGNRGGLKKSKDKGKRSKQRRIAKRILSPPENNRQRPPDHQARRRSRKETFFPSGAKRKSACPARRQ